MNDHIHPVPITSAAIYQNTVDTIMVPWENALTKGVAASLISSGTENLPGEIMSIC